MSGDKKMFLNKTKVLVCDFDETFINKDLELEFVKYYRKNHANVIDYILAGFSLPINIILKKLHLRNLLKAWTFKKNEKELFQLFHDFFKKSDIQVNQKIADYVVDFEGEKVLLTGCYEPLAMAYLKYSNYESIFDKVIGAKTTCNGFVLKRHPFGRSKLNFINRPSVGIGNSIYDRYFLEKCEIPLIFNPDENLIAHAKKLGWREL